MTAIFVVDEKKNRVLHRMSDNLLAIKIDRHEFCTYKEIVIDLFVLSPMQRSVLVNKLRAPLIFILLLLDFMLAII